MSFKQNYDRSDIRRLNTVNVLDELRLHGPLSRAQIAGNLGLTRATVSNIVQELIVSQLVNETEYDEKGTGRPGMLLNINPKAGCIVAVDIDLDCVTIVLANIGQEVLWKQQVALKEGGAAEAYLAGAASLIEEALKRGRKRRLLCYGVCVALAGLVNREDGRLEYGPTSGLRSIPLKLDWERRFKVPIFVENEAHAGAIGAYHFGPAPGKQNFIYLSLGVGLAAGIFVDGVLLRGKMGFAGQVGHTPFKENGELCACGKTGCWVTEIGALAVRRKLMNAGVALPDSTSREVDWVERIAEKAKSGDDRVMDVLNGVAQQIGSGAARLVEAFNPSTVIIGGRLGRLLLPVEAVIRDAMLEATLPYMREPLDLLIDEDAGDPLQGCLATVLDSVMKNPTQARRLP